MVRRFPTLSLGLASIAFSAMAILVHLASARGFHSSELVVWRMGLGALAVAPLVQRSSRGFAVERKRLMLFRVSVGAASIAAYFCSLALLPVGLATLINYLGPLFTTLFAAKFLGERPGRSLVIGVCIGFGGAALTVGAAPAGSLVGIGVAVFAAVTQGAAVVLLRELRRTEAAMTIFFWFALFTALVGLPFSSAQLHWPLAADLPILLGIGLSSLVAQLLLTAAMGHVPASSYALLSPLTPAAAFAVGALWLHEPVTLRLALGAALAILGVGIGTFFASPPDPAEVVLSESIAS